MARTLKIEMEQRDDGSFDAWFGQQPTLRVHASSLDELLSKLNDKKNEFVAAGGDPTALAVDEVEPEPAPVKRNRRSRGAA